MNFPALIQLAQAGEGPPQGSPLSPLLIVGAFMLVFYAFVLRPQRQQEKQLRDLREGIKRGDQVVTSGGIHGKVTGLSDDVITVEIADRVRVKVNRSAIMAARGQAAPAAAASTTTSGEEKP